jgi:xanthine/uracil permease
MTNASAVESALVLRWVGSGLIAIGLINILARNDPGSTALRAVMLGNIALHVIAYTVDLNDFQSGFIKTSAIVMGSVVHILLIFGFLVYLRGSSAPRVV